LEVEAKLTTPTVAELFELAQPGARIDAGHLSNVRVIESRRRPRLRLEARQPLRIRRELGR